MLNKKIIWYLISLWKEFKIEKAYYIYLAYQ